MKPPDDRGPLAWREAYDVLRACLWYVVLWLALVVFILLALR